MEDKNPTVVLRNTMRRPLTFCVAGKTVRLSPGERLEVPGSWLGSTELQHFHGSGCVRTERAATEGGGDEDAGEGGPARTAKGTKDEKGSTTTPHKPRN